LLQLSWLPSPGAENLGAHEFQFMKYIADFNKSYGTREEFKFRMARWIEVEAFV